MILSQEQKALEACTMRVIKWYRLNIYGTRREFIHPSCQERELIARLTGLKTIDEEVRQTVTALIGVKWEEVVAP